MDGGLLLVLVLAACSSPPTDPASAPGRGTSPLGAGYPDPDAIISGLMDAMQRQDFAAFCGHLAALGRSGRPVPLVPGRNVPDIPAGRPDLWPSGEQVAGLRHFLRQPWKQVHYGKPRNALNDPPLVSVPVRVTYDWERIPEGDREMLVRSMADRRKRPVTWSEVMAAGRARERAELAGTRPLTILRFAWLRDRWRFYLR